jgi:hypothetical protein
MSWILHISRKIVGARILVDHVSDASADFWRFGPKTPNTTGYTTTNAVDNNGETNTNTLIATDSDSSTAGQQPHQAAQYCADLITNGQDDWYLPSKNELNIFYGNKTAIGHFNTSGTSYWSSSEYNTNRAWYQKFSGGNQNYTSGKSTTLAVRCARR